MVKGEIKAGATLVFTAAHDRARYGGTVTVERITDVYPTKAHPGPAFTTWVGLKSENGTSLEWQLSTVRKRFKNPKAPRVTIVDTVKGIAFDVVLGEDGRYAPMAGSFPARPLFVDDVERSDDDSESFPDAARAQ